MDEKIEVNDNTVIDLAKIIHKHYQHIKADWEEYTKSDVALAYAIKWNGYRKESDTAQLAIQRFINQLHIDEIIRVDSDLGKELLKEKEFVLKRYYGEDLGEDN